MTNPLLDALHRSSRLRRAATIPAMAAGAAALAVSAPAWAPICFVSDRLAGREGSPSVRAGAAALAWTSLETLGVGATAALWAGGRSGDPEANYRLMSWWADRLIDVVRTAGGMEIEVDGLEVLAPGPVVICARHVSIADAILPAWLLGRVGMRPRYVMKDDLRLDPCLDIVGGRVPNHFVDRQPDDNAVELAEVRALAVGMGQRDGAVIFPEGTTVSDARRARAVERITERDPDRGARVAALRVLGPVRPGGTQALLDGCLSADLVVVTHTGLERLHQLGAVREALPFDEPVRVTITRIPRSQVPEGPDFVPWFDGVWAEADRRLAP